MTERTKGSPPGPTLPPPPRPETPYTFTAECYAIVDDALNEVRTTQYGNLAVFSVLKMAEHYAREIERVSGSRHRVVKVLVRPAP